jgi:hypothetical protein
MHGPRCTSTHRGVPGLCRVVWRGPERRWHQIQRSCTARSPCSLLPVPLRILSVRGAFPPLMREERRSLPWVLVGRAQAQGQLRRATPTASSYPGRSEPTHPTTFYSLATVLTLEVCRGEVRRVPAGGPRAWHPQAAGFPLQPACKSYRIVREN